MKIAGVIPIEKTHRSVTTRAVRFEFACRSCGHTDPAIVQASVEGSSTNEFGLGDLFVNHEFEAQQASRDLSLNRARLRAAVVPCPKCGHVDERVIAATLAKARAAATGPAIKAAVLIGSILGALLWFCVAAIGVAFPDQQVWLAKLGAPIFFGCIVGVGAIARWLYIRGQQRAFDDELIEMQGDVVFRSKDPERYYEIVESRAFTEL